MYIGYNPTYPPLYRNFYYITISFVHKQFY